ncbi:MAG TPA: DUF1553 domain-containing protein [Pirellulaceae bacterium]|jgi:hypothetical protein
MARHFKKATVAFLLYLGVSCLAFGQQSNPLQYPQAATRQIDFLRDIQPLFESRCNICHGEDDQAGQLRLDAKAIVLKGGKSGPLFAAGKSADSLLIKRLVGIAGKRMPLDDDPLTDDQIGLIRAWIDQGAIWPDGVGSPATEVKKHWAYVAPQSPPLPHVSNSAWPNNAIDRFILSRLEKEQISPSPAADRERLIRRASLDLIGLPPAVTEVDAFLAEAGNRPDAYDRLLDRLLASPAYGERWATPWLDAARYADSNGYQRDGHRTIWPFRDWVIRALNSDMPFDRFTIEQIAGDLLPNATLEQQIATGFHRCTTVSVEAGTDEEENRTNQIIDRVNVTGTVWLGTTLECCQCHDHKYDPFTQRDYYGLFAFFNNTPKETYQRTKGSAALEFGGPELELPPEETTAARRNELAARRKQIAAELEQCVASEATGLAAWEREMADKEKADEAKLPANIKKLLAVPEVKRNAKQKTQIRDHFVGLSPETKRMQAEMDELKKQIDELAPPKTLTMTEMNEARATTIFERGSFLSPGEKVELGTPQILPPLPATAPQSRLGLAQWLVDPANPLTARVQVNRAWAQFFGRGLITSEEDFGAQADPPSHPDLLDWLATEFRDHGLSTKQIHRRIAESATYRQSSAFRRDLVNKDPNNLFLARAPRLRLTAELIRDNALAISGQKQSKMFGPPVYPPQPAGIWRVTGLVDNNYRPSVGEDALRRGVYTVWRRSAPYPSFINFDAPDRSACTVKRPRTSTPLQALTLQNDPVYIDLAQALADNLTAQTADKPLDEQLTHAFRTVLCRKPTGSELLALREAFNAALDRYHTDPAAAKSVIGNHEIPPNTTTAHWAAWFNLAQILLNLDETITKN